MLTEALAALTMAGGNALVSAMVTDGWEGVKARFARLLGGSDPKANATAAAQLEESRSVLVGQCGDLQKAEAEQKAVWRTRLGDLLEEHPQAAGELRALLVEVEALVIGSAGRVEQHVTGFDQAQQAVLGTGIQNVNFGGQGERRPSR